ncbi:MAG: PAS domain-containing protein [Pseudomonadota bacterium]
MPIRFQLPKEVTHRQRLLLLLVVMATVALTAMGLSLWLLYRAAFDELRFSLVEIARSQAVLIDAVARFDSINSQEATPLGAAAATLIQIADAHKRHKGFGQTGEINLGRRKGDDIVFLLSSRHEGSGIHRRLPFRGELGEPMRRALAGESGSLFTIDYRGVKVLAAHEPVAGLDAGIVAKIDVAEIRAPFIEAGIISLGGTLIIIALGVVVSRRFGSPLVEQLESSVAILRNAQRIAHFGNWEWDIKGNNVWWSDEVYRLFGLDPKRFTPDYESFLSAVHPQDRDRVQATIYASLESKTPYTIEHRAVLPDGSIRYMFGQAETLFDKAGKPIRMNGTVQDISERKMAELALRDNERSARDRLESRVKERTLELTALNEELHSEAEERKQAQHKLYRSLFDQEIIALILNLSLEAIPLEEILRQSLVLILQRQGFGLKRQGCIFLMDENSGELVMKVRHGLPDSIEDVCGRLPVGRCLCGLAAQSGQTIHTTGIDERHALSYADMEPHGHYCIPIQDEGELFGVLNLYIPEGHQHSDDEEQLLNVIANTLAGVIHRRRAEDALRESEATLAEAQKIAHIGSWNLDIASNKLSWSEEIYRIFGITAEQFGATYEAFIERVHPLDRESVKQAVDASLHEHQNYNLVHRVVQPDGTERTVRERARVDFDADGNPVRMLGTIQDITENERIRLALLGLKEELETKERSRLAALLHDGVGQNLQAINLGLKMISENQALDVAEIMTELDGEVQCAIEQIRNLSSELRPTHLEKMDLAEAIRTHISRLQMRVKADIRLVTDRQSYAFLKERIKEHCFLVFQEALANAVKHADATEIEIRLRVVDEAWLVLEIEDNGSGLSADKPSVLDSGLGLMIIQDRCQRLGGKVNIHSAPGKGTTVSTRVPLQ